MKKSKYSDSQILAILKQAENGVPGLEIHGTPRRIYVYVFPGP